MDGGDDHLILSSPDSTEHIIAVHPLYICPKKEKCPWIRLQVIDFRLKTCMLRSQLYEERAITLRKQIQSFNKLPHCVNDAQRRLFVEQHRSFSNKLQRYIDMVSWLQDCCGQLLDRRTRCIEKAEEHGLCIGFDATREEEATRCGPNCTATEHIRYI